MLSSARRLGFNSIGKNFLELAHSFSTTFTCGKVALDKDLFCSSKRLLEPVVIHKLHRDMVGLSFEVKLHISLN